MAKLVATGAAQARSQITTLTFAGTWAATETGTIKIGGKSVVYVCGGAETPTTVAAALVALCQQNSSSEFREATWTVLGPVITATTVAGTPITIVVSETAAAGTITDATPQAATGPNHWDNVDNWSTGAVPAAADEVYIDRSTIAFFYGLPTSLTLGKFVHTAGQVGLPDVNASGNPEYRPTRAVFTCLDVTIGFASGRGPDRCRLDLASGASVVAVFGSKVQNVDSGYAVDLVTNNAAASIAVISGQVAVSASGAGTSIVGSIRVANEGEVYIGAGVTVTTIVSTGNLVVESAATTLTVDAGITTIKGDSAPTTVDVRGGTLVHKSSGVITTANIGPGMLDCSQDIRLRTITNMTINRGGVFRDQYNAIAITNKIGLGTDADALTAS